MARKVGRFVALALFCSACAVLWGAPQEAAANPASAAKPAPTTKAASYALIFGTVWDPDGRPVYGIHTQLRRSSEKKIRWDAYSDHHGEFAFRVPSGKEDYELAADQRSIKALKNNRLTRSEPVKIHVEFDERVDTGLHLMK
jgi:hypothetical protein